MRKTSVGIIGAGTFGEIHARAYAGDPRAELVAICDENAPRAEALAASVGCGRVVTRAEELLAIDGIEAVSIVTPDFAHRDLVLAAASAGKHILCEKPLATTAADSRDVLAAVDRAGVTLMVDFHNRCNPPFLQAKRAIESGEIGRPRLLSLKLSDTIFVPTRMLSWAARSTVAWFLGSHCVDLVRWLTGCEVERVYARAGSGVLTAREVDTPDFYVMTLELAGGAVATVENCWILSETAPSVFEFRAEIVGSEGHIHMSLAPHTMVTIADEHGYRCADVLAAFDVRGRWTGFAVEAVRAFVSAVRGEGEVVATGDDGLAATRIIVAAEESVRVGTPVALTADWP